MLRTKKVLLNLYYVQGRYVLSVRYHNNFYKYSYVSHTYVQTYNLLTRYDHHVELVALFALTLISFFLNHSTNGSHPYVEPRDHFFFIDLGIMRKSIHLETNFTKLTYFQSKRGKRKRLLPGKFFYYSDKKKKGRKLLSSFAQRYDKFYFYERNAFNTRFVTYADQRTHFVMRVL